MAIFASDRLGQILFQMKLKDKSPYYLKNRRDFPIRRATEISKRVSSAETITRQVLFCALLEILHKILQFIVFITEDCLCLNHIRDRKPRNEGHDFFFWKCILKNIQIKG